MNVNTYIGRVLSDIASFSASTIPRPGPRVLIVSNRLPMTVDLVEGTPVVRPSSGGLATGLRGVHAASDSLWFGWPGDMPGCEADVRPRLLQALADARTMPVELSASEREIFYETICNAVLWPICHDRIDRLPLRVVGWDVYERINERFADVVASHWRPGDVVWVHDYHLLRFPALLRRRVPDARIGFFLHVPFPNPEIFFTLPVRRWLVEGMLGADLIGFHTRRYRGHFTAVMRRLFHVEMTADECVTYDGRPTRLGIFPMGIDAQDFARRATSRTVSAEAIALRQGRRRLLVGVDRLDYSKGIPRRLLAVEQLLLRHPEWRERVRFVQIAVPSRGQVGAYRRYRREVEALVGRINGEFGTPSWTPIQYLYRSVSPETLLALYRAADVMLVTPVRDGMNLVAKEFVAVRGDEDGVLLLSEFAGAVDALADAVVVNPYDVDGVADALHTALTMPSSERRMRMRRLRAEVGENDVRHWVESFIGTVGRCGATVTGPADTPADRSGTTGPVLS